jgi:hypothetical protein
MAAGLSDHVWSLGNRNDGRQLRTGSSEARPLQETSCVMTVPEILDALNANVGKRVRVTFDDGIVQSVDLSMKKASYIAAQMEPTLMVSGQGSRA